MFSGWCGVGVRVECFPDGAWSACCFVERLDFFDGFLANLGVFSSMVGVDFFGGSCNSGEASESDDSSFCYM